jgi:pyrroline-5-carboxylate reductase
MSGAKPPVLVVGAGAMGGAIVQGWLNAGVFQARDLMIVEPYPSVAVRDWAREGARLNPPAEGYHEAATVLFAVKPQTWRAVAAEIAPRLSAEALIVSVAAGVGARALAEAFGARPAARVMPTLAVAVLKGAASVYAERAAWRARAVALFAPLGQTCEVEDEDLMHAATAVSGSGPAYYYAFVEALEAAAAGAGLPASQAAPLVRATLAGAAALLSESGASPQTLRRQVTSPGGTTEAALEILQGELGLEPLLARAVAAAAARSRSLAS